MPNTVPLPQLPTVWNVYNLRGSPFFQDTLIQGHDRRSLDLFVGRRSELSDLRLYLHGRDSSRQAIAGAPGVGKTTLVQMLKGQLLEDGYLTTDSLVPFVTGDTPESLFGRALGAVYDTILANRPMSGDHPAMQAAQQMVRATRLPTGGGGISVLGVGGNISKGVTLSSPKDLLIDGPRVLRDLMNMVRATDEARGLLLHLNNLESLSGRDALRAADLLQSLRDPMLLHEGLHIIVVGTVDAVNAVVNTHAQVRSVFRAPLLVQPLQHDDVHDLLRVRYEQWKLQPQHPVSAPVHPRAVDRLLEVFQGDLRGLLKALDDGVEECIGLASVSSAVGGGDSAPVPPVGLAELSRALQARYATIMQSELDELRVRQIYRWIDFDPSVRRTQKDLTALWDLTQGTVSAALAQLVEHGYIVAQPRQGRQAIAYSLTGKARLIAGL